MHINELKAKSPQQLLKLAEDMGIENPSQLNVQQLRFGVMRAFAADNKVTLIGDGVLERMQDDFCVRQNQIIWLAQMICMCRQI